MTKGAGESLVNEGPRGSVFWIAENKEGVPHGKADPQR